MTPRTLTALALALIAVSLAGTWQAVADIARHDENAAVIARIPEHRARTCKLIYPDVPTEMCVGAASNRIVAGYVPPKE